MYDIRLQPFHEFLSLTGKPEMGIQSSERQILIVRRSFNQHIRILQGGDPLFSSMRKIGTDDCHFVSL
jgi:energy-converting hydrogenase Eha subunit H